MADETRNESKLDSLADTLADEEEDASAAEEALTLARGASVGRYLVAGRIGQGGMGQVYQAFDPDLNRPVALKLLHVAQQKADQSDELSLLQSRLLREAQALAQLSHPNVVTVYDVGTFEDAVFIAMELVEGKTLQDWLAQDQPSPADLLPVMKAAGQGLAAAHRAGIIHRDFKPANVIIGQDGRVRVLDFGLARAVDAEFPSPPPAGESDTPVSWPGETDSTASLLSSSLTLAGAILGTPGYMAPEQYLHQPTDERSDQFSFCVVLFEALYGTRPFAANSFKEMARQVTLGRIRFAPEARKVAPWLAAIVRRGLEPDPQERFASLPVLLVELEKDPELLRQQNQARRGRWLTLSLALILLLVLGVFGLWYSASKGARLCSEGQLPLAGIWDPATRQALRAQFLATGRAYAEDTFNRVATLFDQKTAAWLAMRKEACEATRVHGTQSDHLLDLRMSCLDRRLSALGALAHLLATQTDGAVIDRAVSAVVGLADLTRCADADALPAAYPPPEAARDQARLRGWQKQLDTAMAMNQTGKYRAGVALARRLEKESRDLDYPPLRAVLLDTLGDLQSNVGEAKAAEQSLRQAMLAAAAARDDHTFALSLSTLLYVVGYQQARHLEALALETNLLAAIKRAGDDANLRARAFNYLGVVCFGKSDNAAAQKHFQKAIALWEQSRGLSHPPLASALNNLGMLYTLSGQQEKAMVSFRRALQIWEKTLGPDHPNLATSYNNLGEVYRAMGQHDQAKQHYRRALQIREQVLGPEHEQVASPLHNLGSAYEATGECVEAINYYQRALAVMTKSLGAQHPKLAYPLTGLGSCLVDQDQPEKALVYLLRALEIRRAHAGNPVNLARTRFALARALWTRKPDRKRALDLARKAQAVYAQAGKHLHKPLAQVDSWLKTRN